MSTAVLYTTTDNIRAALGVSAKEISDQRIADTSVADQIEVKLIDVFPTHATLATNNGFPTGPAPGGHPTADEAQQWLVLKLFCMYYGAVVMLPAAQNLFFSTITDGQTAQARFQSDDLEETMERITSRSEYYAGILNPADYSTANGLGFKLVSAVTPLYNPVTGLPTGQSPFCYNTDFVRADLWLLAKYGFTV